MALPDDDLLKLKQVKKLYGVIGKESAEELIMRGTLPPADYILENPKLKKCLWSVGHLKDYLKLPTELREPDPELLEYFKEEVAQNSGVRKHSGSQY